MGSAKRGSTVAPRDYRRWILCQHIQGGVNMRSQPVPVRGTIVTWVLRMTLPFVVVLASFLYTTSADAIWYAGNKRDSAYGVQAYIWTPTSYPYIAAGGEFCWVSTCGPDWLQAGWAYWQGWAQISRYVEVCISGGYDRDWYGSQALNSSSHYKVHYGTSNTWWAYIDGGNKGGFEPISAPRQVQALAEVQESSSNTLDTRFVAVQYKDSGGQYGNFDTANWSEDSPYEVAKYSYYDYRSWGP